MAAFLSRVTNTRPANTTAYTAGDAIGNSTNAIWTFEGVGNRSQHMLITSVDIRINVTAIPSGMTSFRLHLYTASQGSAYADNAAWDLPSGDRATYAGYIDLGSPADVGSTLYAQVDQVNKHIKLGGGADPKLYGYLVTNGGFTPAANSEDYVVTIRGIEL